MIVLLITKSTINYDFIKTIENPSADTILHFHECIFPCESVAQVVKFILRDKFVGLGFSKCMDDINLHKELSAFLKTNSNIKIVAFMGRSDYHMALEFMSKLFSPNENTLIIDAVSDINVHSMYLDINYFQRIHLSIHMNINNHQILSGSLESNTTIEYLKLYLIGETSIIIPFVCSVAQNNSLKELLIECPFPEEGFTCGLGRPDNFQIFCDSLKNNTTIEKLSLANCCIDNTSAVIFADLLRTNTTITELNVDNNNIGNQGMLALCKQTNLRSLSLSQNIMKLDGMAMNELCDNLQTNCCLQSLNLDGASIKKYVQDYLLDFFEKLFNNNFTLVKLSFGYGIDAEICARLRGFLERNRELLDKKRFARVKAITSA